MGVGGGMGQGQGLASGKGWVQQEQRLPNPSLDLAISWTQSHSNFAGTGPKRPICAMEAYPWILRGDLHECSPLQDAVVAILVDSWEGEKKIGLSDILCTD